MSYVNRSIRPLLARFLTKTKSGTFMVNHKCCITTTSNLLAVQDSHIYPFAADIQATVKRQGTFLVFPEIPSDTPETNPFLVLPHDGSIPFDQLKVEHIVKACGKLSIEFECFLENYSQTLSDENDDKAISASKLSEFIAEMEHHLLPLHYNLNLLLAFRLIRPSEFNFTTIDQFYNQRFSKTRLRFQNRNIYTFMCEMKARREALEAKAKKTKPTSSEQAGKGKKEEISLEQLEKANYVDRYIREAKLAGLSLKDHDKLNTFNLVNTKLREEQNNFYRNWRTATDIFHSNIISPQFLDCLPDHVITQIDHHNTMAIYQSFLRYCPDQNLRNDFWLAYNSRAAPFLGSKVNNYLQIEKIRNFRHMKANIFGYDNYAQMGIDLRGPGGQTMAGSVENVRAFINGLAVRSDARFLANLQELKEFAMKPRKPVTKTTANLPSAAEGLIEAPVESLNLWDLKYYERLFCRETYQVESRAVRVFFPLDKVVQGMLEFAEKMFNIKIVEMEEGEDSKTWNKNVRHFKVFDNRARSMGELGSFYFDPFQREGNIFMPLGRSESMGTKPAVFWLMNLRADAQTIVEQLDRQEMKTRKHLLNFYQVIDLFGNFGFVLQHILSEVGYTEIGAMANVESDAAELVFHFLKLWPINSYETLARCSAHIQTGEPISRDFHERLRKSYYHFASLNLKQDLYQIALDLNLHTTREHSSSLQKSTWREWMAPFEPVKNDGHVCSLIDLFGGFGFEGVFHSGKWSEVIAADCFEAFRETTPEQPESVAALGERFRETFLALNGAVPTNELFRRYRGRDPTLNGYMNINQLE